MICQSKSVSKHWISLPWLDVFKNEAIFYWDRAQFFSRCTNIHCETISSKDRLPNKLHGHWLLQCSFTRKYLSINKLPSWLCYFLQGHLLHAYLFDFAGLTGAMEQKSWHLVSTNEKWQMHKSFKLWRVEISVWHKLGLFDALLMKTSRKAHGSLMSPLICKNGQSCCSSFKPRHKTITSYHSVHICCCTFTNAIIHASHLWAYGQYNLIINIVNQCSKLRIRD